MTFKHHVAMKIIFNPTFTLSVIILCISVSSCRTILYAPTTQLVPLHKEKGEIITSAEIGTSEYCYIYSGSTSISVVENFALGLSGTIFTDQSEGELLGKGLLVEPTFGYFFPISPSGNWIFQGTLGVGFGRGSFSDEYNFYSYGYRSVAVIPSFGYSKKYFEVAFSTKLSYGNYTNILEPYNIFIGSYTNNFSLQNNANQVFIEPSFCIRGGLRFIKLQLRISTANSLTNNSFPMEELAVSLGLVVDFNLLDK